MKKLQIYSLFVLFAFLGCKKTQRSEREHEPAAVKPAAQTNISAIMHSTGCTYSWGYWKTHGPAPCSKGNNANTWPVTSLTIAGVTYTDLELCAIMQTSSKSNIKIQLLHQLIGALLNVANGANNYIQSTIDDAETAIANNDMTNASDLIADLDEFNLGGPNGLYHCGPATGGGGIGQP